MCIFMGARTLVDVVVLKGSGDERQAVPKHATSLNRKSVTAGGQTRRPPVLVSCSASVPRM